MQDSAVLYSDRIIDRIYQIIKMLNWHRSDLLTHFAFLFFLLFLVSILFNDVTLECVFVVLGSRGDAAVRHRADGSRMPHA